MKSNPIHIYALMLNMIEAYEKYLEIIGSYLGKFFEQQKPYIFCKEGCSICCENGSYPFSKLEFEYLMTGYEKLPDDKKTQIQENIKHIKELKNKSKEEKFSHVCPFLLDKKCSVYMYRALICRSYGLMYFYDNKKGERRYHIPCCVDKGLNYSNVYDKKTYSFPTEKWKQTGIEVEPVSHNVSLAFLLNNELTQYLNIELNPQKVLMDWFD